MRRAAAAHEVQPLGLHQVMFIPTIQRQGTPDQVENFAKKAQNYEILGTYAQTELGHGIIVNFDPVAAKGRLCICIK